eukprot:CAMPEP_0113688746 /NCGR_PEP_ID=MMETSP0038_2-20120614/16716_1 /TAXON_ID=2898 /ORGANISM="Cryptomonas paramecium" /LENGTH=256 /DNA_ID=CAMNT_0000609613 /DNA_START=123 /DNA_END=889 /DNA_ORIENTATION=+ /assembly_acc=CAM_ASM_000170
MSLVGVEMRNNELISQLNACPHSLLWNDCLKPFLERGARWAELPWYVGETYVYHRLLEASGFWDPSSPGYNIDIFAPEKQESLTLSLPQVYSRIQTCLSVSGQHNFKSFSTLVRMSLWGNQGDNSLFTIQDMSHLGSGLPSSGVELLVDDANLAWERLLASAPAKVHLITDNAGLEFVSDLALAHYLLSLGPDHVAVVQLHLKPYPFFVSDATSTDLDHTLALLSADATPGAAQFAQDLRRALSEGRLVAGGTGAV